VTLRVENKFAYHWDHHEHCTDRFSSHTLKIYSGMRWPPVLSALAPCRRSKFHKTPLAHAVARIWRAIAAGLSRWQAKTEQPEQGVTSDSDNHGSLPCLEGVATQDAMGASGG
jgi:hypothetical protein